MTAETTEHERQFREALTFRDANAYEAKTDEKHAQQWVFKLNDIPGDKQYQLVPAQRTADTAFGFDLSNKQFGHCVNKFGVLVKVMTGHVLRDTKNRDWLVMNDDQNTLCAHPIEVVLGKRMVYRIRGERRSIAQLFNQTTDVFWLYTSTDNQKKLVHNQLPVISVVSFRDSTKLTAIAIADSEYLYDVSGKRIPTNTIDVKEPLTQVPGDTALTPVLPSVRVESSPARRMFDWRNKMRYVNMCARRCMVRLRKADNKGWSQVVVDVPRFLACVLPQITDAHPDVRLKSHVVFTSLNPEVAYLPELTQKTQASKVEDAWAYLEEAKDENSKYLGVYKLLHLVTNRVKRDDKGVAVMDYESANASVVYNNYKWQLATAEVRTNLLEGLKQVLNEEDDQGFLTECQTILRKGMHEWWAPYTNEREPIASKWAEFAKGESDRSTLDEFFSKKLTYFKGMPVTPELFGDVTSNEKEAKELHVTPSIAKQLVSYMLGRGDWSHPEYNAWEGLPQLKLHTVVPVDEAKHQIPDFLRPVYDHGTLLAIIQNASPLRFENKDSPEAKQELTPEYSDFWELGYVVHGEQVLKDDDNTFFYLKNEISPRDYMLLVIVQSTKAKSLQKPVKQLLDKTLETRNFPFAFQLAHHVYNEVRAALSSDPAAVYHTIVIDHTTMVNSKTFRAFLCCPVSVTRPQLYIRDEVKRAKAKDQFWKAMKDELGEKDRAPQVIYQCRVYPDLPYQVFFRRAKGENVEVARFQIHDIATRLEVLADREAIAPPRDVAESFDPSQSLLVRVRNPRGAPDEFKLATGIRYSADARWIFNNQSDFEAIDDRLNLADEAKRDVIANEDDWTYPEMEDFYKSDLNRRGVEHPDDPYTRLISEQTIKATLSLEHAREMEAYLLEYDLPDADQLPPEIRYLRTYEQLPGLPWDEVTLNPAQGAKFTVEGPNISAWNAAGDDDKNPVRKELLEYAKKTILGVNDKSRLEEAYATQGGFLQKFEEIKKGDKRDYLLLLQFWRDAEKYDFMYGRLNYFNFHLDVLDAYASDNNLSYLHDLLVNKNGIRHAVDVFVFFRRIIPGPLTSGGRVRNKILPIAGEKIVSPPTENANRPPLRIGIETIMNKDVSEYWMGRYLWRQYPSEEHKRVPYPMAKVELYEYDPTLGGRWVPVHVNLHRTKSLKNSPTRTNAVHYVPYSEIFHWEAIRAADGDAKTTKTRSDAHPKLTAFLERKDYYYPDGQKRPGGCIVVSPDLEAIIEQQYDNRFIYPPISDEGKPMPQGSPDRDLPGHAFEVRCRLCWESSPIHLLYMCEKCFSGFHPRCKRTRRYYGKEVVEQVVPYCFDSDRRDEETKRTDGYLLPRAGRHVVCPICQESKTDRLKDFQVIKTAMEYEYPVGQVANKVQKMLKAVMTQAKQDEMHAAAETVSGFDDTFRAQGMTEVQIMDANNFLTKFFNWNRLILEMNGHTEGNYRQSLDGWFKNILEGKMLPQDVVKKDEFKIKLNYSDINRAMQRMQKKIVWKQTPITIASWVIMKGLNPKEPLSATDLKEMKETLDANRKLAEKTAQAMVAFFKDLKTAETPNGVDVSAQAFYLKTEALGRDLFVARGHGAQSPEVSPSEEKKADDDDDNRFQYDGVAYLPFSTETKQCMSLTRDEIKTLFQVDINVELMFRRSKATTDKDVERLQGRPLSKWIVPVDTEEVLGDTETLTETKIYAAANEMRIFSVDEMWQYGDRRYRLETPNADFIQFCQPQKLIEWQGPIAHYWTVGVQCDCFWVAKMAPQEVLLHSARTADWELKVSQGAKGEKPEELQILQKIARAVRTKRKALRDFWDVDIDVNDAKNATLKMLALPSDNWIQDLQIDPKTAAEAIEGKFLEDILRKEETILANKNLKERDVVKGFLTVAAFKQGAKRKDVRGQAKRQVEDIVFNMQNAPQGHDMEDVDDVFTQQQLKLGSDGKQMVEATDAIWLKPATGDRPAHQVANDVFVQHLEQCARVASLYRRIARECLRLILQELSPDKKETDKKMSAKTLGQLDKMLVLMECKWLAISRTIEREMRIGDIKNRAAQLASEEERQKELVDAEEMGPDRLKTVENWVGQLINNANKERQRAENEGASIAEIYASKLQHRIYLAYAKFLDVYYKGAERTESEGGTIPDILLPKPQPLPSVPLYAEGKAPEGAEEYLRESLVEAADRKTYGKFKPRTDIDLALPDAVLYYDVAPPVSRGDTVCMQLFAGGDVFKGSRDDLPDDDKADTRVIPGIARTYLRDRAFKFFNASLEAVVIALDDIGGEIDQWREKAQARAKAEQGMEEDERRQTYLYSVIALSEAKLDEHESREHRSTLLKVLNAIEASTRTVISDQSIVPVHQDPPKMDASDDDGEEEKQDDDDDAVIEPATSPQTSKSKSKSKAKGKRRIDDDEEPTGARLHGTSLHLSSSLHLVPESMAQQILPWTEKVRCWLEFIQLLQLDIDLQEISALPGQLLSDITEFDKPVRSKRTHKIDALRVRLHAPTNLRSSDEIVAARRELATLLQNPYKHPKDDSTIDAMSERLPAIESLSAPDGISESDWFKQQRLARQALAVMEQTEYKRQLSRLLGEFQLDILTRRCVVCEEHTHPILKAAEARRPVQPRNNNPETDQHSVFECTVSIPELYCNLCLAHKLAVPSPFVCSTCGAGPEYDFEQAFLKALSYTQGVYGDLASVLLGVPREQIIKQPFSVVQKTLAQGKFPVVAFLDVVERAMNVYNFTQHEVSPALVLSRIASEQRERARHPSYDTQRLVLADSIVSVASDKLNMEAEAKRAALDNEYAARISDAQKRHAKLMRNNNPELIRRHLQSREATLIQDAQDRFSKGSEKLADTIESIKAQTELMLREELAVRQRVMDTQGRELQETITRLHKELEARRGLMEGFDGLSIAAQKEDFKVTAYQIASASADQMVQFDWRWVGPRRQLPEKYAEAGVPPHFLARTTTATSSFAHDERLKRKQRAEQITSGPFDAWTNRLVPPSVSLKKTGERFVVVGNKSGQCVLCHPVDGNLVCSPMSGIETVSAKLTYGDMLCCRDYSKYKSMLASIKNGDKITFYDCQQGQLRVNWIVMEVFANDHPHTAYVYASSAEDLQSTAIVFPPLIQSWEATTQTDITVSDNYPSLSGLHLRVANIFKLISSESS